MTSVSLAVLLFVATLHHGRSQTTKQETEELRSTFLNSMAKLESKIDSLIGAVDKWRESPETRSRCASADSAAEARRLVNCTVNVQAYSGQDPCHVLGQGLVHLNGLQVWSASYCGQYPNRRGVNMLDIDPFSCRLNGVRRFDTWFSSLDANDLSAYMQYVRDGAVLVGVTGDEPMQQLSPALTMLRAAGIFVNDVPYRGNFAFVIQKGFTYKTVTSKGVLVNPARIDIQLTGSSLDDLEFTAIERRHN